jgi:hypothetical protein
MRRTSSGFLLLAILASFSLFVGLTAQAQNSRPVLITQNVDESKLVTLAGNTRPEANKQNDRGLVTDNLAMDHMLLQLKRSAEQEQELGQYIDELQDPSSPNFHQWLTAKEYGERFGLATQDLNTITRWLESHGFTVNVVYENGLLIDFSGTAGEVRAAFHTEIHHLDVKGVQHLANMSDPQIPAALAPAIIGVVSLHDFKPHTNYKPRANYTFSGCTGECYAVVPGDLATIYNLNPLFTANISGQGQTIVVIEDTDVFSAPDWTTFRTTFGLSTYTSGTFTQVHPAPPSGTNNCSDPEVNGDEGEAILDAEYASAAAPSATIELASCSDTTTFGGLIAILNLLNESTTPPAVMSMSYGECEAFNGAGSNAAFSSAFQQAVTEGVSFFVSAGDQGAASCSANSQESSDTYGIGVSGWASTPYNVAVGGTDFGDTYDASLPGGLPLSTYWNSSNSSTYESAKSYIPEIPWNDSCASLLGAEFSGFTTTYGTAGFCNSAEGENNLTTAAGSGGPSGCATGSPSTSGVVSGTCLGWPKPSWQSVVGNPSDGVRDMPDVSLFSANGIWGHYYPFCDSDGGGCSGTPETWAGAGGTSFASPIMAGIQALVNQKAGGRQGNPNPVYYSLAKTEYGASGDTSCNSSLGNTVGSSCIFYDVTLGDMDVDCLGANNCYLDAATNGVLSTSNSAYDPAFGTKTGWDFATGIGTVNAANLVNHWPSTASFTLAAAPTTVSVAQGTNGTSTITVTPAGGFTGSVSLAASGLPNGVTAGFNPASTTTTSTLTLTASASATTGPATVTITGTSGSLTATTTVSLTVTSGPGFTLTAAPPSVTITPTLAGGTSTITVTDAGGFTGNVHLAASGLPSGVTAGFSPNPTANTSTLTLTASGSASVGTTTVTITGTSGSLTATTTVAVTVTAAPSFTLAAAPGSVTITPTLAGGTSTITVTDVLGFTGNVSLAASGLPNGVTAGFSPNPTANTSTLTLTASGSASVGTTTVTITGTSGSLTATTTVAVTVTAAPNFTLTDAPSSLTLNPGGTGSSGTSTITVNPTNGFTGSVHLAATGLPSGVTAAFVPNPTTSTSTLTLTASGSATPGAATVTITGTSGSLAAETTTVALTVNQNITVSSPTTPPNVPAGETVQFTFNVTAVNGSTFVNAVTFGNPPCNNLPDATVTCTVSPIAQGASSPQQVTVTIKTSGPNTGCKNCSRSERRADNRSPWIPLTLPLAGIVLFGLAGRKMSRHSAMAGLCISLALLGLLLACGGGSSTPPVAVSVSQGATVYPSYANWPAGTPQTTQFTATVTNSTNTAVTWSVSPVNGGSISATGLYTAPPIALGLPGSATITATSQADTTKTAQATETITPTTVPGTYPTITVTATEGSNPPVTTADITLTVQ